MVFSRDVNHKESKDAKLFLILLDTDFFVL